MSIPQTLLSLLYHGTVSPFREEMHHDIDNAYRRFAIDAWLERLGALSSSSAVRAAIEELDLAAYRLRSAQAETRERAKKELVRTSTILFHLLAPLLAAEIANGVKEPDQTPAGDSSFLTLLYLLLYSKDFRDAADSTATTIFKDRSNADASVRQSWDFIRDTLKGTPRDFEALKSHTQTLCEHLNAEFIDDIWTWFW